MIRILNAKEYGTNVTGAVYVGRPSKFGNPFEIGKDGNRNRVIDKFEDWILDQPELILQAQEELRGKHLICWCAPKRCHAEILRNIANYTDEE